MPDKLPPWIQYAAIGLMAIASLNYFATNSQVSANETKYYNDFAKSSDLTAMEDRITNRLERIENILLDVKRK